MCERILDLSSKESLKKNSISEFAIDSGKAYDMVQVLGFSVILQVKGRGISLQVSLKREMVKKWIDLMIAPILYSGFQTAFTI